MTSYLDNALMIDSSVERSHDWGRVWHCIKNFQQFKHDITAKMINIRDERYYYNKERHNASALWAEIEETCLKEVGINPTQFKKLNAFCVSFQDLRYGAQPNDIQVTKNGNSPKLTREEADFILDLIHEFPF